MIDDFNEWVVRQGPDLTLLITVGLLVIGLLFVLFIRKWKTIGDIGIGLLVGALFAFTSYTNQLSVQTSDFRSSVNLTHDLSGFDPQGQSMSGMSLANKNFRGARLFGADLRGANLQFSDLREANLRGAHLNRAILFYATFLRADLDRAHLEKSNLRGAKITTTAFLTAEMDGASVDANTCWNIPLEFPEAAIATVDGDKLAKAIAEAGLDSKEADGSLGRVCYKREVGSSAQSSAPAKDNRIMICPDEPYLYQGTCPNTAGE